MKRSIIAVALVLAFVFVCSGHAEEIQMHRVLFPFGLLGIEDSDEFMGEMRDKFGEFEERQTDNGDVFYSVENPDSDLYGLPIRMISIFDKWEEEETRRLYVSVLGTKDDYKSISDMFDFFITNYGTPYSTNPIKKSTDINGNTVQHSLSEDYLQITDALFDGEPFEYSATWGSIHEMFVWVFIIKITGTSSGQFSAVLTWSAVVSEDY